ncbi:uncharacterized protein sync [Centroberyx gerrardi]
MEDDNVSSSGFEPLFIQEEDGEQDRDVMGERVECNTTQSGLTFAGTQLNQSAPIQPYLQEMDDLLKSCEELTGVPFGSHFSPSYADTSLSGSTQGQLKEYVMMDRYRETSISPQPYLSTTYIDTRMDRAGPEEQQQQDLGSIINRYGGTAGVSPQTEMSLTSAGTALSGTMVEYQGQLLGMLAMLESCMEEAGMDFDPQEWATDANQEYVHISQNPSLYRATTLGPMGGRTERFETQSVPLQSWAGQPIQGATEKGSMESRDGVTLGSATKGSPQKSWLSREDMGGISVERLERSGTETGVCMDFKVDEGVLEPQLMLSEPSMPMRNTQNETGYCEGTHTRGDISSMDVGDTGLPAEGSPELKMEVTDPRSGMDELEALGSRLEECIEEVQHLERKREELLVEVLDLRGEKEEREEAEGSMEEKEEKGETEERMERKVAELMEALKREAEVRREERQREVQSLREQRAEEERRVWKVNVERQGLQEEARRLKRRLFTMARDCAHSQAALTTQQREVELFKREEEKLESLVLQLTEEGSQLRSAQQQQLSSLKEELHAQGSSQTSNTQEITQEMTQCKRHSCGDIQQYLQGGLKALEERYEPMLLTLLKRREIIAAALVKAREQAQELKVQLGPLREESQRLGLQRACLEERLKLMHIQRKEDVGQYKETVYFLEERSRELKTELKVQKRKMNEMEELKNSLTKQLLLYKAAIEDHNKCDHREEKT